MRNKQLFTAAAALALLCSGSLARAADPVVIDYTLSGNTYNYTIENVSLANPITLVDIYFPSMSDPDALNYSSIKALATLPAGWVEGATVPPSAPDLGGYVEFTATGSGIAAGSSLGGFGATFTYTGSATLGSQYFELDDPITYAYITSDQTVLAKATVPDQCTWLSYLIAALPLGAMRLRAWRATRKNV